MCDFFGDDSPSRTETRVVQQTNELPPHLTEFSKENIEEAKRIASRPYEAYTGARIANFTPDQLQGFDLARQAAGQWQPFVNTGAAATADVAGRGYTAFPEADIGAYMDPFLDQVLDAGLTEINRQGAIDRNQISAQMQAAGAFDSARHGVLEAEQRRNQERARADITANLLSGGFRNAQQMFQADEAQRLAHDQARLAGGQQLSQLGALGSQLGYQDAASFMDIGEKLRLLDQSGLDIGYQDFLNQLNYPIEMLNLRLSTGTSTPYSTNSVLTEPVYRANTSAQNLGAFGALAGGLGALAGIPGFGL